MAPLSVENVPYHEYNNVHRTNNREWTDDQNHRIVEIDAKERSREKHFMKRVKERGETEFPTVARTAQNLIDSARRFRKKGWGRPAMKNDEVATTQIPLPKDQKIINVEWTTEMKVTLIIFDNEKTCKK